MLDFLKLEKVLSEEPRYRVNQARKYIIENLILDWTEATSLPASLREKLNRELPLIIFGEVFFSDNQKTTKAVITLKDGLKVETVLMRHKDGRNTVCVSSQVGCPLGCLFCKTGQSGFKRNLEVGEILDQALFFARFLKKEEQKITNIVLMGMGEPFLNYENVMEAIRILNSEQGFKIGARKISISTVGIPAMIKKLADEGLQVNLAVSLHAANGNTRNKIIPANKNYPLGEVIRAVDQYILRTKRKVMFEYVLLKGINDSDQDAEELAILMKKPLYFLNLITYNQTSNFQASPREKVNHFKNILLRRGVEVTVRYKFGEEIDAACGQLAGKMI